MVAATHTDHDGLRDGYFFAYARNGGFQPISFRPDDQGIAGPSYVYNYLTGAGKLVPAAGTYTDTVNADSSYYVVAPVGSSGIALLGDAGKFVSLGSKRISRLSDDGTVHTRVTFATNEKSVTPHGYAPKAPRATATDGTVGAVHYDTTTHLFTATVTPGSDHNAAPAAPGVCRGPGARSPRTLPSRWPSPTAHRRQCSRGRSAYWPHGSLQWTGHVVSSESRWHMESTSPPAGPTTPTWSCPSAGSWTPPRPAAGPTGPRWSAPTGWALSARSTWTPRGHAAKA